MMFLESKLKNQVMQLSLERKALQADKGDCKEVDAKIRALAPNLEVDWEVQIALRFGELDYELIERLQKDELIDRALTPQTGASIRIVLGTLVDLLERTGSAP